MADGDAALDLGALLGRSSLGNPCTRHLRALAPSVAIEHIVDARQEAEVDDTAGSPNLDDLLNEAMALIDDHGEDYERGCAALEQGDYEAAAELLRPLADLGHPEAAYWLAVALHARSVEMVDLGQTILGRALVKEAVYWFRFAEAEGVTDL